MDKTMTPLALRAVPPSKGGTNAYSYLELVITMGILAVIFSGLMLWQRGYVRAMKDAETYYAEREAILNRIELKQADKVTDVDGLKRYEINWHRKIIWLSR